MAIERDDLLTILEVLRGRPGRGRLLILGDALIHFDTGELTRIADRAGFLLASVPGRLDPFTLGAALGFERTDTLDVNGRASLELDLHEVPDAPLHGAFDCIIDAGVLFWCSDPGAALRTILVMTHEGGTIAHVSAVSGYYGRGYYNIHPLLLEDFYLRNGCEFALATYRPRFRPRGVMRYLRRALGNANVLTRSDSPGQVYLQDSAPNRITFGPSYREPVEAAMVPNNVLGVFVFIKGKAEAIRMPLRSTAYDDLERTAG
jgi:hypothetical protein